MSSADSMAANMVASSLIRAYFLLLDATSGEPVPTGVVIPFQFNPTELSFDKQSEWSFTSQPSAEQAPDSQFVGTQPQNLSVPVVFNSPLVGVSAEIDLLMALLEPTPDSVAAGNPQPPIVQFGWGDTVYFTAYCQSISTTYKLFGIDGRPIRAECTVALVEVPSPTPAQNPTSGALATTRVHTLLEGESLPLVAWQEYGKPGLWRALAEANGIDDPFRLTPGRDLLVPDLADASASA
jgi:phage protein U